MRTKQSDGQPYIGDRFLHGREIKRKQEIPMAFLLADFYSPQKIVRRIQRPAVAGA